MSASRKDIRETFANLLRDLVTAAQVVYDHQPGDFGGQSPAVTVGSGGSERSSFTFAGSQSVFYLDVHVFVRVGEDGGPYTQADAEDALDAVEQQIAASLDAVRRGAKWESIDYAGRSEAAFVLVDGLEYKRESIPLQVTVFA
jgi:hypothetical protein